MDRTTKYKGEFNENRAISYIEDLGFNIIERNFYARKLGEIDIIALKDDILHFIEVKSAEADFDPIYNITPNKLKRVINSTLYYLKKNSLDVEFSIDVILIRGEEIEFLENVTL
jgi:putative endonuclease